MAAIPEDISRRISNELDGRSAVALSCTGRAWREVGERRSWRKIDLTAGDEDRDAASVHFDIQRLYGCISSHPPRASYIKHLTIRLPSRSKALLSNLVEILRLVSPTVQLLDLYLSPCGLLCSEGLYSTIEAYSVFTDLLDSSVEIWDRILELRLTVIGEYGMEMVLPLISRCPRLRTLVLRPLNALDPSSSSVGPCRLDITERRMITSTTLFPDVPTLRSLSILPLLPPRPSGPMCLPPLTGWVAYRGLFQRIQRIVGLVPHFSGLEWLSLGGPHPYTGEQLGEVLGKVPRLKGLYLDGREDLCWDKVGGGSKGKSGIQQVWLRCGTMMDSRNRSNLMLIPPLTGMETLTLLCATSAVHRVMASFLNPQTRTIPTDTISQLRKAPLLTTIHLSWIEPDFELDPTTERSASAPLIPRQLEDITASSTLCDEPDDSHFRCLVSSFTHPLYPDDLAFVLFHLRLRIPVSQDGVGGCTFDWFDTATYRGRSVPLDTLRQAYEAIGRDFNWRTGDRKAVFNVNPDSESVGNGELEAWDILDDWSRSQACISPCRVKVES